MASWRTARRITRAREKRAGIIMEEKIHRPARIYSDMRDAIFEELFLLAKEDKNIVLLMGDQGAQSFKKFREQIPEQFINAGIAEQNMIGVAAGLALAGKKPFVHAIANFVTLRCYEQIKINLGIMRLPIVLMGIGAGYAYGADGPTHHSIQDVAAIRAIPGIAILNASDTVNASVFPGLAVNISGPAYIRFDKGAFPSIYDYDHNFNDGLAELRPGKEVVIVSTGVMVHTALEISDRLRLTGIQAGVIDLYRIKPLNEQMLACLLEPALAVVTLEEHIPRGGIGTIVSDLLCDRGIFLRFKRFGLPERDSFDYGSREWFSEKNGLTAAHLTGKIASLIGRKI